MSKLLCKHTTELHVGFLGSEGSGKTCFLAGLEWLANVAQDSPFRLSAADSQTQLIFNEYSKAFREHRLPAATHRTDSLLFDIRHRGRNYRVSVRDFEGEVFKRVGDELQTDNPIFDDLLESDVLLVFLDSERDVKNADPNSNRLAAVSKILGRFDMADQIKSVAIILSKADTVGISPNSKADAARFLKKYQPQLFRHLDSSGHNINVFFLASIGHGELSTGRAPDPFGYEPLFDWIGSRFLDKRRRIRRSLSHAALACIAVGVLSVMGTVFSRKYLQNKSNDTLNDPNASITARAKAYQWASEPERTNAYNNLSRKIENARDSRDIDAVHAVQEEVVAFGEFLTGNNKDKSEEQRKELQRLEEELFVSNKLTSVCSQDFSTSLKEYATKVANGTYDGHGTSLVVGNIETTADNYERINALANDWMHWKVDWPDDTAAFLKPIEEALIDKVEDLFVENKLAGVSRQGFETNLKEYTESVASERYNGHGVRRVAHQIEATSNEYERLEKLASAFTRWKKDWSDDQKDKLHPIEDSIIDSAEMALKHALEKTSPGSVEWECLAKKHDSFAKTYPSKSDLRNEMNRDIKSKRDEREKFLTRIKAQKQEIKPLLNPSNHDALTNLLTHLRGYEGYDGTNKQNVVNLCDEMALFLEMKQYTLTNIVLKTLVSPYRTFVKVSSGEKPVKTPYKKGTTYEISEQSIRWKAYEPLTFEWRWKSRQGLYSVKIAQKELAPSPTALLELLVTDQLEVSEEAQQPKVIYGVQTNKCAFLSIGCKEIANPHELLDSYRRYINPGEYWKDQP